MGIGCFPFIPLHLDSVPSVGEITFALKICVEHRGGSRFSGKGFRMCKGVGVRFADFISFFCISHENEIIWSH